MNHREQKWVPWILFGATFLLLITRLNIPERYIFDEVYHAYTAGQYVEGNTDAYRWDSTSPDANVAYMWNHPPLGVWLIAGGISISGNDSFGWRVSSAVFGALGIVIAYFMALSITGSINIAMLTGCLLMMDGLYFTQSRIGMLDIYGVVFMMCALWSLYAYLTAPPDKIRRPLVLTGCFLGLAIATKWNAGLPAFFTGLAILGRSGLCLRTYLSVPTASNRKAVREHLIWVPIALVVCPATMYLLAYLPFFFVGNSWADFIELQKQIFLYHTGLKDTHPYFSQWWEWPLATRPVWYAVDRIGNLSARIYAGGNPFLYWLLVPAVCWVLWLWRRDKKPAAIVLAIGFFGQWLPWAAVSRVAFAYHFLPAVPFGCLALAVALAQLSAGRLAGKVTAAIVVLIVISAFVYFYPLHAHIPLTTEALEHRMWFTVWR